MHWRDCSGQFPSDGQLSKVFLLFAASVFVFSGCDRIGGKTVLVEMRGAPEVESGLTVRVAGVEVGVSGTPKVVAGKVEVPVHLYRRHRDALPPHAVFVLGSDPARTGEESLVVYDLGPELAEKAGPAAADRYRGFASVWELALVIGRKATQQLVGQIEKALEPASRSEEVNE